MKVLGRLSHRQFQVDFANELSPRPSKFPLQSISSHKSSEACRTSCLIYMSIIYISPAWPTTICRKSIKNDQFNPV
jgi:hypothetical protein